MFFGEHWIAFEPLFNHFLNLFWWQHFRAAVQQFVSTLFKFWCNCLPQLRVRQTTCHNATHSNIHFPFTQFFLCVIFVFLAAHFIFWGNTQIKFSTFVQRLCLCGCCWLNWAALSFIYTQTHTRTGWVHDVCATHRHTYAHTLTHTLGKITKTN